MRLSSVFDDTTTAEKFRRDVRVGDAWGCKASCTNNGEAVIDLRGTGYKLADAITCETSCPNSCTSGVYCGQTCGPWRSTGWYPQMQVECDDDHQYCRITCGGGGGGCEIDADYLQLAPMPPSTPPAPPLPPQAPSGPWYLSGGPLVFSILLYLLPIGNLIKVIGRYLKAPQLRDEGELTAYVSKMQRAQLQVSFSVVCSHTTGGSRHKNSHTGTGQSKTVVTHRSSHPFTYSTSTDVSTLTKNWQQPAGGGGGEDGGLGTGFVAVVSSGLSWSAAKGATADKLKAEKKRLYDANKHRDKTCSVTVRASLPGQHSDLLYAPAGAKFTKRLSCVVELLLVFFGLGAPLFFYYKHKLSRHVAHTVRKTIYIEGHAAPAGHDA
mmetsp:Transcript_47331/g.131601  ORF Transcript_47331/g.131601 Transcript_47331/m.131601 type:complete len:380 (+) Transcript_47331:257-1396(+)